jgi:hypothetical protein
LVDEDDEDSIDVVEFVIDVDVAVADDVFILFR